MAKNLLKALQSLKSPKPTKGGMMPMDEESEPVEPMWENVVNVTKKKQPKAKNKGFIPFKNKGSNKGKKNGLQNKKNQKRK